MTTFLATTALREFWPEADRLLLLGRWCLPGAELCDKDDPNEYAILPYPWDDPREFARAATYVTDTYERVLAQLAVGLNLLHGLERPLRYWRIVVGPWLATYVQVLYDRYACLRAALLRDPETVTIALDPSCYAVPHDYGAFVEMVSTDEYNLQLYSQILDFLGHAAERRCLTRQRGSPTISLHELRPGGNPLKRALRRLRGFVDRALVLRAEVAIVGTALPATAGRKLWLMSGGKIACAERFKVDVGVSPRDDLARSKLQSSLDPGDEMGALIAATIFRNIPKAYVEDFATRRRHVVPETRRPKLLLSATSWLEEEDFKIFAAEAQQRGSRILATQHGGYYGTARFDPLETHEETIADRYYSWGWTVGLIPHADVKPMAALRMVNAERIRVRGAKRREDGPIVFVTTTQMRYLYRFQSHYVGSQWADYLSWQLRFAAGLGDDVRSRLVVRPYFRSYGWPVRDVWEQRFPGTAFDGASSMPQLLADASLVLVDHPATTMLEALAADVPTILFWDAERNSMRKAAEPWLEALRRAGILHATPEAAASKVIEVAGQVQRWWRRDDVQRARESFSLQFARTSPNWMVEWMEELRREAATVANASNVAERVPG